MAGRDLHLPRLRLAAAREHSSSPAARGRYSSPAARGRCSSPHPPRPSGSGRRVYALGGITISSSRLGNRWLNSSSDSSSSGNTHEWDSPGWLERPLSRFSSSSSSPGTWTVSASLSASSAGSRGSSGSPGQLSSSSGSSSTSSEARSAAVSAPASPSTVFARRVRELNDLRKLVLTAPLPPMDSAEDWERRRQHGLLPEDPPDKKIRAPDPDWGDTTESSVKSSERFSGYVTGSSSNRNSTSAFSDDAWSETWSTTPRLMKTDPESSPTKDFSVPMLSSNTVSSGKSKGKKPWKRNQKHGRHLQFGDEDDDDLY